VVGGGGGEVADAEDTTPKSPKGDLNTPKSPEGDLGVVMLSR